MSGTARKIIQAVILAFGTAVCALLLVLTACYLYIDPQIPPIDSFRNVELKAPLRIYSSDGKLMQEFGERLIPIQFDDIPVKFLDALLDTEDKRFFEHSGVDLVTLFRATVNQLLNPGEIGPGGSTITMQLVKNISGSNELKFIRKFKEILLALKLEDALTKDEILSLYLNIIPFGKHAYGIQAASNVYYGKDISDLTLAQMAMLAGIPKAPERNNPINNPEAALERRNLVLRRMLGQNSITRDEYQTAVDAPNTADVHGRSSELEAPYISEMVRKELQEQYGLRIYSAGFEVHTTIDSTAQRAAQQSLLTELIAYDLRHGYRGPERHRLQGTDEYLAAPQYGYPANWTKTLASTAPVAGQQAAIVLAVEERGVKVLTGSSVNTLYEVYLEWDALKWARPYLTVNTRGPLPTKAEDIAKVGDLIRISGSAATGWALGQKPDIQGALVAISARTGAIQALVGGADFNDKQFNHVTQAKRQPGSVFKPFIYTGALENGLTAASMFNDQPMVMEGGQQEETYRPTNSGDRFRGNIRLREALYRSINLVSLRVVLTFGAKKAVDYVSRFGFDTSNFPRDTQLAFGGGTIAVSPLEIATAYCSIANGGYKITGHFIERVETISGEVVFENNLPIVCTNCDEARPAAERIIDERVAFIMNSLLRDVIQLGTARKAAKRLQRGDIAGKTGTTNDADIWFAGFTPQLVATTWIGFDDNTPVGSNEYGSTAPLDIWMNFMEQVLPADESPPLPQPPGIVRVRINKDTGLRTTADDPDGIFEIFREELVPPKAQGLPTPKGNMQPLQNVF